MVSIKGLQKTSMIDYPGKMCSIIFTANCNMRCPFCQNPDLILKKDSMPDLDEDKIIEFMNSRKEWLDGVCITGGEPLIYDDLHVLMKKFKDNKFLVKLDTNGLNPELLKKIIEAKLVDYIAMDIKSDKENYSKAANVNVDMAKIEESIKIIKESEVEYEFRSTIVPEFFDEKIVENISVWLKGSKKFYLQQFRSSMPLLDKSFEGKESYPESKLEEFKSILAKNIQTVEIR